MVSQHVLVGKRLKDVHFRQTYGAAVLGVHRSGDCQLSLTMCTRFLLSANCLPHQCISTVTGLLANVFFAEQTNQKQAKHLACKSFCCSRALNARTKGTMLEDMHVLQQFASLPSPPAVHDCWWCLQGILLLGTSATSHCMQEIS